MYPRAAPVVRRTLFLRRRAVRDRTHAQPRRRGEGGKVGGRLEDRGTRGADQHSRVIGPSGGRCDDDLLFLETPRR